jgi:hypothetical protein
MASELRCWLGDLLEVIPKEFLEKLSFSSSQSKIIRN